MRTLDIAQKDKIFAIGYCFGGGGVFELARAWPNTAGLLGKGLWQRMMAWSCWRFCQRCRAAADRISLLVDRCWRIPSWSFGECWPKDASRCDFILINQ